MSWSTWARFANPEARAVLDKVVNDTVVFPVLGTHDMFAMGTDSPDADEFAAAEPLEIQFANFGLLAYKGSYTSALAKYPLVKVVNREVTVLDPAALLIGNNFHIPISGLYNPSPLPVTVYSTNWATDTFVLAPGTYTVTYTASGTCDFNPSVSIFGSVSIPVVHVGVDSQQVNGSVSITVQTIGHYLLDPGSPDCDWSVTISQP